jgi:hypothetical protein
MASSPLLSSNMLCAWIQISSEWPLITSLTCPAHCNSLIVIDNELLQFSTSGLVFGP